MKTLKQPVSILCVKTGSKYTEKDVKILYKMVKRNCTLPFIFYCLTDNACDLPDGVVGIKVDQDLDLETYWWKICLFDLQWNENVLYLDLDIVIQNNIDYIFQEDIGLKLKCLNINHAGIYYPCDGQEDNLMTIPPGLINSSLLYFNPIHQIELYNEFIKDANYNIIHYYGLDRFIFHNSKNLTYFDFSKDYYFRAKGQNGYDEKYIDDSGIIHDPRKTFCIMNQRRPGHLLGLEKYFI